MGWNTEVRVIFTNQSAAKSKLRSWKHLIESGEIAAYFIDQWISVRGKKNHFQFTSKRISTTVHKGGEPCPDLPAKIR